MRRLSIVLAALLAVALACSSSGDDDDRSADDEVEEVSGDEGGDDEVDDEEPGDDDLRSEYVDSLLRALEAAGDAPLSDDDLQCVAAASVDGIGVDTFISAGVAPDDVVDIEDLSGFDLGVDDEVLVSAVAAEVEKCEMDLRDLLVREAPEGISNEHVACVVEAMMAAPTLNAAFSEAFAIGLVTSDNDGAYEYGTDLGTEIAPAAFSQCPDAVAAMLLSGAENGGAVIDAQQRACVEDEVRALTEDDLAAFGQQDPAAQQIAIEIFAGCGVSRDG